MKHCFHILSITFFFLIINSCTKRKGNNNYEEPLVQPQRIETDYLLSQIKINNEIFQKFHYDDLNRLTKLDYYISGSLAHVFEYKYDNQNRIIEVIEDNEKYIDFVYENDILKKVITYNDNVPNKIFSVTYNSNQCQLESNRNDYPEKYIYTYNNKDNLTKIEYIGTFSWTREYSNYDESPNLSYAITHMSSLLENSKNNAGKLVTFNHYNGMNFTYNYEYAYLPSGLIDIKFSMDENFNVTETWTYSYIDAL